MIAVPGFFVGAAYVILQLGDSDDRGFTRQVEESSAGYFLAATNGTGLALIKTSGC